MTGNTMEPERRARRGRAQALPRALWTVSLALLVFIVLAVGLALLPGERPSYEDSAGWNLRLVNRWNPIPEGYTVNLRELPGGEKVDERVYESLMEMLEAAKEGNWGEAPRVISGYRTEEEQRGFYDDKVNEYLAQGYSEEGAKAEAVKWVAVPGTSEHQLGLAVDLEGETYDVFFWLQENSYKYGFIFRYPGDKTDLTGTAEEVWHYRYVGAKAAKEMHERGLCLEEYLGQ